MAELDALSNPASPSVGSTATAAWKKIVIGLVLAICLLVAAGAYLWFFEQTGHSKPTAPPAAIVASGDKTVDAIRRGVEFLKTYQEADGGFSCGLLDPKPALTALVVDALARSPEKFRESSHSFMKRAAEEVVRHQQPDGSICTPIFGLENYCTCISIMALSALENPAYQPVIEKAKKYLLDIQHKEDEESPFFGGTGYGAKGRVDGSNTAQWVEALKTAGVKEDDPAFKNAEKFFSRLQNNTETNDRPVAGTEVGNDGGFFYRPGESKAEAPGKDGKKILKSYGLMSYAGLKSFLHLKLTKDEPRVQSAYRWVKDNYTLEENRNIGADGLYYYYLTMAKALALYGEPVIETTHDGQKHNWAEELRDKLLSLQDPDGGWKNKQSDKWKEDDAVMVTAFAIRTLTICHEEIARQKAAAEQTGASKEQKN